MDGCQGRMVGARPRKLLWAARTVSLIPPSFVFLYAVISANYVLVPSAFVFLLPAVVGWRQQHLLCGLYILVLGGLTLGYICLQEYPLEVERAGMLREVGWLLGVWLAGGLLHLAVWWKERNKGEMPTRRR